VGLEKLVEVSISPLILVQDGTDEWLAIIIIIIITTIIIIIIINNWVGLSSVEHVKYRWAACGKYIKSVELCDMCKSYINVLI